MKPNFLKLKKVGKCLCKYLIKKTENDARGENAALMKKGLRLANRLIVDFFLRENAALMKKGLRLLWFLRFVTHVGENAALMKKGLRPPFCNSIGPK